MKVLFLFLIYVQCVVNQKRNDFFDAIQRWTDHNEPDHNERKSIIS